MMTCRRGKRSPSAADVPKPASENNEQITAAPYQAEIGRPFLVIRPIARSGVRGLLLPGPLGWRSPRRLAGGSTHETHPLSMRAIASRSYSSCSKAARCQANAASRASRR